MSNKSRRFPFAHAFNQLLRVLLPAVAIAMSANSAGAQDARVGEGSRVRISVPGTKRLTGVVKSRTADSTTIFVEGYGGTQRFLNSDVTELKISRGRSWTAGAKRGAIWGGSIGAIMGLLVYATPDEDDYYTSVSKNELAANMLAGSLVWGVGIGALVKAEQWDNIPVHPRFAASPTSGGVGVSVTFSPSFLH